jgi:pimeloyl-ACP methyl ester carboxylesterase
MRTRWLRTWAVAAVTALTTLGLSMAQDPAKDQEPDAKAKDKEKDKANAKNKAKAKRRGGLLAPGGAAPPKEKRPNAADPLAKGKGAAADQQGFGPEWPFSYRVRIAGSDQMPLAAYYYPAKQPFNAPVLMLLHETGPGRSAQDFEEKIPDLKDLGFAQYLQDQGYAVLSLDLRGHGANPRRELTPRQWQATVADLQTAYTFLVARHNRGEFNLAKLGVIATGDAANLAANWAATAGAAVSSEDRISDLAALVLVDPIEDARGLRIKPAVTALAPRVPILLVAGEKHTASFEPVKELRPIVARQRLSRVDTYQTGLHGIRLVQHFPKVATAITRFLDDPLKSRVNEWEGRYLLNPVAYHDEGVIERNKAADAPAAKKAAGAAEPAKNDAEAPAKKAGARKAGGRDQEDQEPRP